MSESVVCSVRFSAGTHQTSTVRGQRASSTMSAEQAAKVLACKHESKRYAEPRDA